MNSNAGKPGGIRQLTSTRHRRASRLTYATNPAFDRAWTANARSNADPWFGHGVTDEGPDSARQNPEDTLFTLRGSLSRRTPNLSSDHLIRNNEKGPTSIL
jgi:hypothetical protein